MFGKKPSPIQFTKEGYEKLKSDKQRLTLEREEVIKRLQAAREMGDLSENGMYKAAKFELGNIDRQLRKTNMLLEYGQISLAKSDGTVSFASTVLLKLGEKEVKYLL